MNRHLKVFQVANDKIWRDKVHDEKPDCEQNRKRNWSIDANAWYKRTITAVWYGREWGINSLLEPSTVRCGLLASNLLI